MDAVVPDISVIVVTYRSADVVSACLRSVGRVRVSTQIVVIDNASDDGSADLVATSFPHAVIVKNKENVGFARAVNQAMGLCRGRTILLLNPDTEIEDESVELLLTALDADRALGAVGPLVTQPAGRRRVLEAGRQLTTWRMFTHATGLSRLSARVPLIEGSYLIRGVHDDHPRDVGWISGACMLIRTDLMVSLGGLNDRWFMYAEDFELCLRITGAGWRLRHLPAARVSHHMNTSGVGRRQAKIAWAMAWRSYHRDYLARGALAHSCWRAVFAFQLMSRASYFLVRATLKPGEGWASDAYDFGSCAIALFRPEPSRRSGASGDHSDGRSVVDDARAPAISPS
jgi:N-acetylglucosaminyl-diphospho-decaprenol L-rhamnosyltransferase